MKIAIYTRVSTEKQDYENQLYDLKEYCKKQGWQIYKTFEETISGKENNRPEFKKMLAEASEKRFDGILVWALDRFTREGVAKAWQYISQLDYHKIEFFSFKEPFLNTDNKMVKDMLFSIMGVLAEQERIRISDRTKSGLKQARLRGIQLGKPAIADKVKEEIIILREQGKSYREICEMVYYWDRSRNRHNVSMGFVHKTLLEATTRNSRKEPLQLSGVK